MDRARYDAFTAALTERLAADPRVLGLVALGSMAAQDYEPDAWSDHDFYVVTEDDAAEAMRQDLSWLPDTDRIVLALRETAHGVKILYDDAHLLEFAVFTRSELAASTAGRARVLLDRGGVADLIATVSTRVRPADDHIDVRYELAMAVTNVLVGVGRWHRGERLSGHVFVTGHALGHLLRALAVLASPTAAVLDGLDARRRFELAHPTLGAELAALLQRPVPEAGLGLLAVARRELGDRVPPDVVAAMNVVEQRLSA